MTPDEISRAKALRMVKLLHTAAWAFFVACILAIPLFAWREDYRYAAIFIGIVFAETLILIFNGWRCPLTAIAERYTTDRRDNFDIYLPEWLARHNKTIFGALYIAGIVFTLAEWTRMR
jgi:polyferredoxin